MKKNFQFPREFIEKIPKSDLHLHLDGSIRIETLIELAKEQKVELPSYTVAGLRELVFKKRYRGLADCLKGFKYTTAVLQTPEALERSAYEVAWDNINEGVRYIELRFAPQLHVNSIQTMEDILTSVNRGLDRAKLEYNTSPAVQKRGEPPFEYGIIVCALRQFTPGHSPYYKKMFEVHQYSTAKDIFSIASTELAKATVMIRDARALPIVGFDLAGEEAGYPAEHHWEAFDYAHRHFLKKTVHAGEAYGPESIFQAITDLKADRIGHGCFLFHVTSIKDKGITDRYRYVRDLAQYVADRRITIEVCLTSNMQTNPKIRSLAYHPFRAMRKHKLSTTICTDNRTVSGTSVTNEVHLAANTFGLSRRELKDIVIYGFKRSFFPKSYLEKRNYVRKVIDYYEKVEKEYFGEFEPKD